MVDPALLGEIRRRLDEISRVREAGRHEDALDDMLELQSLELLSALKTEGLVFSEADQQNFAGEDDASERYHRMAMAVTTQRTVVSPRVPILAIALSSLSALHSTLARARKHSSVAEDRRWSAAVVDALYTGAAYAFGADVGATLLRDAGQFHVEHDGRRRGGMKTGALQAQGAAQWQAAAIELAAVIDAETPGLSGDGMERAVRARWNSSVATLPNSPRSVADALRRNTAAWRGRADSEGS